MDFLRKICYLFIILFTILNINALSIAGLNINLTPSKTNLAISESFSINASITSSSDISLEIINLFIMYDNDIITINKIKPSSRFKCINSCNYDGCVGLTLRCNKLKIEPNIKTPLLSITLETTTEANFTEDSINSMIYLKDVEACDHDGIKINNIITNPLKISIGKPKEHSCLLKSLMPSIGSLNPNFDPYIFNYFIDVDYDINEVNFLAETLDPEASFKISRKRLRKAGEITDIHITVRNNEIKEKQIYTVSVNRQLKPELEPEPAPEPWPEPIVNKVKAIKTKPCTTTKRKKKVVKDEPEEDKAPPCCLLNYLNPFFGTLTPEFDPNIFDYAVDVEYDIKKLEFDFEAMDPNAYARVTKKRLGKAGTSTNIDIIVKNNKSKQVYSIVVNRAEKPITPFDGINKKRKRLNKHRAKYKKYKKKYKKDKKKSRPKNKILTSLLGPSSNRRKIIKSAKRSNLIVNRDQFVPFMSGLSGTAIVVTVIYIMSKKPNKKNNLTSTDPEETDSQNTPILK